MIIARRAVLATLAASLLCRLRRPRPADEHRRAAGAVARSRIRRRSPATSRCRCRCRRRSRPPTIPIRCGATARAPSSRTSARIRSATSSPSRSTSPTRPRSPTTPSAAATMRRIPASTISSARRSCRSSTRPLPTRIFTADSNVVERRQGLGRPLGSAVDQCRRRGHAGAAERQSGDRGQAGNPRQFRSPRTDRRRRRAAGGHRERQHHRLATRSPRRASPMAAAARSPTCSSRATASRCCDVTAAVLMFSPLPKSRGAEAIHPSDSAGGSGEAQMPCPHPPFRCVRRDDDLSPMFLSRG